MQPSSRDLHLHLCQLTSGAAFLKLMGIAIGDRVRKIESLWLYAMMASTIYMGVAQLIWLPCLASSKYTLFGYIYIEIDKTNKLGIQAKVQFQDVGVAQLITWPRPFEKKSWTGESVLMYTTYSFIHKEFVECLCVNSCGFLKSEVIGWQLDYCNL